MKKKKKLASNSLINEVKDSLRSICIELVESKYIKKYVVEFEKRNKKKPSSKEINTMLSILVAKDTVIKEADLLLDDFIKSSLKSIRLKYLIIDSTVTLLTIETFAAYIFLFLAKKYMFEVSSFLLWCNSITALILILFYSVAYILRAYKY